MVKPAVLRLMSERGAAAPPSLQPGLGASDEAGPWDGRPAGDSWIEGGGPAFDRSLAFAARTRASLILVFSRNGGLPSGFSGLRRERSFRPTPKGLLFPGALWDVGCDTLPSGAPEKVYGSILGTKSPSPLRLVWLRPRAPNTAPAAAEPLAVSGPTRDLLQPDVAQGSKFSWGHDRILPGFPGFPDSSPVSLTGITGNVFSFPAFPER
jgi:hypothetical protein